MDSKELFSILNSTLWQDFNGFLREDESNFSMLKDIYITLVCIVFSPFLLLLSHKLLYYFLLFPFQRRRVAKFAYDIEVTTSDFKLIRNKDGKCGLCMWNTKNEPKVKLLLKSRFDKITRSESGNAFILEKKGLFGLYGANVQKIILDCKYTSISNLHDDIFLAKKGETEYKYNSMGDRILL